jgi:serine/threonine protein kinase
MSRRSRLVDHEEDRVSRLGAYTIIDRLAVGGIAEIYRARDERTGTLVVVKKLRADLAPTARQQEEFLREIEFATRTQHRNVVHGLEVVREGGHVVGVLEYVDGQDLGTILARARTQGVTLPLRFATYILDQILDGLAYVQTLVDDAGAPLRLVHRDLAPKNIFVRYDGEIRIGDFGLCVATALAPQPPIAGTPGYLSPEQARGAPLDGRSDLFAVGLIGVELATGQPAFRVEGRGEAEVLALHAAARRPPLPAGLPERLALVLEAALSPDPDDRYANPETMRAALRTCEHPPESTLAPMGLATMVRRLFDAEYRATRLPGSMQPFQWARHAPPSSSSSSRS